jgi:hypothetical protein
MIAAGLACVFVGAGAQESAPSEVAVAGRWMKLPLPPGMCVLDETPDAEADFSATIRMGALKDGQQVLLPFGNCADLKAYQDGTGTKRLSYGSYDAMQTEGETTLLPRGVTLQAFLAQTQAKVPEKFDAAAINSMFAEKVSADANLSQIAFYKADPDADYIAILQRFEPEKRKDKPIIVAAMRAVTVIDQVPMVVMMVRFDGHDASIYDDIQRQEAEMVRLLHAANP